MIKMRIESLIERAYMKRDEKNKALYIYVPWSIAFKYISKHSTHNPNTNEQKMH